MDTNHRCAAIDTNLINIKAFESLLSYMKQRLVMLKTRGRLQG